MAVVAKMADLHASGMQSFDVQARLFRSSSLAASRLITRVDKYWQAHIESIDGARLLVIVLSHAHAIFKWHRKISSRSLFPLRSGDVSNEDSQAGTKRVSVKLGPQFEAEAGARLHIQSSHFAFDDSACRPSNPASPSFPAPANPRPRLFSILMRALH